MNFNLYINSFAVEITRICNLSCSHCLRGDAFPIEIGTKTVQRFFDAINYKLNSSFILYTGGEPGVAIKQLYRVHNIVNKYTSYDDIFISTNGYNFEELINFFLYAFKNANNGEYSQLRLSDSQFHQMSRGHNIKDIYNKYSYIIKNLEYQEYLDEHYLINDGYAKNHYDLNRSPFEICQVDVNYKNIDFELLYLSAKGRITFGCDMSYENIDKYSISINKFKMLLHALVDINTCFSFEIDKEFIIKLKNCKSELSIIKLIKKNATFD